MQSLRLYHDEVDFSNNELTSIGMASVMASLMCEGQVEAVSFIRSLPFVKGAPLGSPENAKEVIQEKL